MQIPCSFAYKVVCIDDKFKKPVVLYRGKNAVNKFIEGTLLENEYCKQITRDHDHVTGKYRRLCTGIVILILN